jgi:hypothetical protein
VLPATASQSTNLRPFPKTVRHAATTVDPAAVARATAASDARFKAAAATKAIAATPLPGSRNYGRKKEYA